MTADSISGWHSGISDGVALAPMIPASRATARVSPFGTPAPRSSSTTAARDEHPAGRRRGAGGDVLGRDVDHPRRPRLVHVGQPVHGAHPCAGLGRFCRGIRSRGRAAAPSPSLPVATVGDVLGHHDRARWTCARSPIRCEPCPPTGVTAPSSLHSARTNCRRPSGERMSWVSRARTGSVGDTGRAAHHRAEGRQHEHLEGEVRRHRVAGQREDRDPGLAVPADEAEALRLARLHRDPAEPHGAQRRERLLDHVVVALRHAARGDHQVGADELVGQRVEERRGLVGDDADPVGESRRPRGRPRRAGRSCRRRSSRGPAASPRSRSSEPVEMTTTRGRGRARTVARPTAASSPRCRGPSTVPLSTSRSPSATSSPAGRTCCPTVGSLGDPHLRDAAVGPLVGHHRVAALRARAPRS